MEENNNNNGCSSNNNSNNVDIQTRATIGMIYDLLHGEFEALKTDLVSAVRSAVQTPLKAELDQIRDELRRLRAELESFKSLPIQQQQQQQQNSTKREILQKSESAQELARAASPPSVLPKTPQPPKTPPPLHPPRSFSTLLDPSSSSWRPTPSNSQPTPVIPPPPPPPPPPSPREPPSLLRGPPCAEENEEATEAKDEDEDEDEDEEEWIEKDEGGTQQKPPERILRTRKEFSSKLLKQLSSDPVKQMLETKKRTLKRNLKVSDDPDQIAQVRLIDRAIETKGWIEVPSAGWHILMGIPECVGSRFQPNYSIEDTPHPYFKPYFYDTGEFKNYIGQDQDKQPVVVSVEVRRKSGDSSPSKILMLSKNGYTRLALNGTPKGKKSLLRATNLLDLREVSDAGLSKELLRLEQQHIEGMKTLKFGVLYCKDNQTEDEMFGNVNNDIGKSDLDIFLNILGDRIILEGWSKFRGGLDVKNNTTGKYSIYSSFRDHEIMFHVSTLLPFHSNDKQHLERKRHLGNDIVVIIFKEGNKSEFSPNLMRSQFNHIFAVVHLVEKDVYRVAVYSKYGVPLNYTFPPFFETKTPEQVVSFRNFFLTLLINAERKAMGKALGLSTKIQRTQLAILQNLASQYR